MSSENPYSSSTVSQVRLPLRQRSFRVAALVLALAGVGPALAGHVAQLPASATAAGEMLGGVALALAGFAVLALGGFRGRDLAHSGKLILSLLLPVVGGAIGLHGYFEFVYWHDRLDRTRQNLREIERALREYDERQATE
jgi:hypothetical protein